MNAIALEKGLAEFVWQVIESDPERFRRLTGAVIQPVTKRKLTTKEVCEQLGISYHTWNNHKMNQHPEIISIKDSISGRGYLFNVEDLPEIERIWKEHNQ